MFSDSWPEHNESMIVDDSMTIAIQVNGKLRGNINVPKTVSKEDLLISAREQENVSIHLDNKDVIKEIVVPQRLVNFVVK